jgi:hypothetical protein
MVEGKSCEHSLRVHAPTGLDVDAPMCVTLDEMRKQYHFRPGAIDLDAWNVHRLVELTASFPVKEVDLDSIWEVDSVYWFNDGDEVPTVRSIVEHMRLVNAADLSFPIILGSNGCVMDGMHRVVRALLEGRQTIRAVQFEADPEPDFRNCKPRDLPY